MLQNAIEVKNGNLASVRAALNRLDAKVSAKTVQKALTASGRVVRDVARSNAPVLKNARKNRYRRVGTLRRAISVRTSKNARQRGKIGVFVNVRPAKGAARGSFTGRDPYYWRWVEFGTKQRRTSGKGRRYKVKANRGRMPAFRFLESASGLNQQVFTAFEYELKKQLVALT